MIINFVLQMVVGGGLGVAFKFVTRGIIWPNYTIFSMLLENFVNHRFGAFQKPDVATSFFPHCRHPEIVGVMPPMGIPSPFFGGP